MSRWMIRAWSVIGPVQRDAICALITEAGLTMTMSKDGKNVTRLNLDVPAVSAPCIWTSPRRCPNG
jgi:hypothetical protein